MRGIRRIHSRASGASGPLLYLARPRRVALGEWVTLQGPDDTVRRGQVIDAGDDVAVVQVMEDTLGLPPGNVQTVLEGATVTTPVGTELLGRILDGLGRPLDDLPAPVGSGLAPIWGQPLNPIRRLPPEDFIETGVSAIDGMNTLVRGQKLPVFSGPGIPSLDLAAQIVEGARAPRGEPFAVVFVAMGITRREVRRFVDRLRGAGTSERTVAYLNEAADPAIERLMAPRFALTVAEHLAFEEGLHVLVVLADVTHYCEALREISAAREEIPGRRGYPGYMYTDLASLFERAGLVADRPGSLTQIPILTMPDDDITHPIPDLTGYITEGQVVLSRDLHKQGVFPPIDVLPSLSRLMKAGIGQGKTVPEHRRWADQLYATYAQGREARMMVSIVGEAGLTEEDRRAVAFADAFERRLVDQGRERRTLAETLAVGWSLLETLPRSDLHRIDEDTWARRPKNEPDEEA